MELSMISRQNQLSQLETFLKDVDTEVTMILQSLQWDRKHLLEKKAMVACQYSTNHRVPPEKLLKHEQVCFLKSQGYSKKDRLLPSPLDPEANTLVKLSSDNIADIISDASRCEVSFKRVMIPLAVKIGAGCSGHQPLTVERLQATYTSDERRAIHDAVVKQVPSCHDLSDLALLSENGEEGKETRVKSRMEVLAELRDMKRRRTKYRVAAKTRNYSDVLRDVIHTQMEMYSQTQDTLKGTKKEAQDMDDETETQTDKSKDQNRKNHTSERNSGKVDKDRYYESHHDERERRKRWQDDYKHSSKYSRTDKNYRSASSKYDDDYVDEKTKNYYSTSSSSSAQKETRKYYDAKEKRSRKSGRHHDRDRDNESKQNTLLTANDIKKEKTDLTESADYSKSGSSKSADKYTRPEKDRSKNESKSSNEKNGEKIRSETLTIKQEVDYELYDRDDYETEATTTEKYYDDNRHKKSLDDEQRQENDGIATQTDNREKESNWSDDSEENYSEKSKVKSRISPKLKYKKINRDYHKYEDEKADDGSRHRSSREKYHGTDKSYSRSKTSKRDDSRKRKLESSEYRNRKERY